MVTEKGVLVTEICVFAHSLHVGSGSVPVSVIVFHVMNAQLWNTAWRT